ncbi:MAG: acylneuraminate cytidylyltransferase family protein [Candidatus Paceibacterales bacterium]
MKKVGQSYKILCLIPARGGSKRIPKKNIVPLLGRPMIEYVFNAVKKSKLVNRIILTTDDEEIARIGRKNGIEIPFKRPQSLATNKTPTLPVLKHALKFLKEKENYWPDFILLVTPDSPLIQTDQIDRALKLLIRRKVDSVETVIEVPTVFHPYNERYIDKKGFTHFLMPKERAKHSIESGKRPKIYAFGNLFAFKPENLFKTNTVQGKSSISIIIDRETAWDVNDPFDLFIAECLMRKRKKNKAKK